MMAGDFHEHNRALIERFCDDPCFPALCRLVDDLDTVCPDGVAVELVEVSQVGPDEGDLIVDYYLVSAYDATVPIVPMVRLAIDGVVARCAGWIDGWYAGASDATL